MDMTGSQRIEAPREKVYGALNDIDMLKLCIPGCETIERLSDTQMRATVTLRVGPVKASFVGMVTLSDLDPPNGYTITGEGSGGAAGFAKGGAKVSLTPDGQATILNYTAKAEIGGRLAQLGGRLIDSTAKKLAADFFEKFGALLVKSAAPAEAIPAGEATKEGWLGKILGSISALLQGWLGKILGSTGALFLGLGLYGQACCVMDHVHAADAAVRAPVCTETNSIGT